MVSWWAEVATVDREAQLTAHLQHHLCPNTFTLDFQYFYASSQNLNGMTTSFANISAPILPSELINCKLKREDKTKTKDHGQT